MHASTPLAPPPWRALFRLLPVALCALAGHGLAIGQAAAADALAGSGPARPASGAGVGAVPANTLSDAALVQALRGGGLVVYLRHGKTDLATEDTDRHNLDNCATQRRLSAAGRTQMQEIGQVIRQLGIAVSVVRSSPYCRASETARLAFGRVEIDPTLVHTVTADAATTQRLSQALQRALATVPEAGSNTVLVGHTGNLLEAAGLWPSPEGVAIVFKPDGRGRFDFVARLPPEAWAGLKAAAPARR